MYNERGKNRENGILEHANIEDLGREDDLLKIIENYIRYLLLSFKLS